MISADKLRAWLDVLEELDESNMLIERVIYEMREEYVRAVRREAEVA